MAGKKSKSENAPQPEDQPSRLEGSLQAGAGAGELSPELLEALSAASGAAVPAELSEDPEAAELAAAMEESDSGMLAGKADQPDASTRELGGAGEDRGLGSGAFEDGEDVPDLPAAMPKLPPEEAQTGAPLFSPAAFEPPDVLQGVSGGQAPVQPGERPFRKDLVDKLVTGDRIQALWNRADAAKTAVDERVHSLTVARNLLDLIRSARNEIMGGEEFYEEAERYLNEVEYRVIQDERMRRWSNTYGLLLFLYELAWGSVLAWWVLVRYGDQFMNPASSLVVLIISMALGGIGGVMGGFFSLIKHVALDQDFDRQHSIWYVTAPIMGLGVGVVVYLIMGMGFLSLTIGQTQTPSSPLVVYILAWLGGYQHNVFTDIVKRLLKVFANNESSEKEK